MEVPVVLPRQEQGLAVAWRHAQSHVTEEPENLGGRKDVRLVVKVMGGGLRGRLEFRIEGRETSLHRPGGVGVGGGGV